MTFENPKFDMNKEDGDSGKFKASDDSHSAVCYGVWYIGTQKGMYENKPTLKKKYVIAWEIDELIEDPDGDFHGKRKVVSNRYNLTLSDNGSLMKLLKPWLNRDLTADEITDFDLHGLVIGLPCLLTTKRTEDGKYVNIEGIGKLHKSMTPLEVTLPETPPKWVDDLRAKSIEATEGELTEAPVREGALVDSTTPPDDLPF